MPAATTFHKYEGLGNDFIVVEARDEGDVSPELASNLCDRRFGIGADGVLLLLPPRRADCAARMRVINADGSIPEMCGNGVRCIALHLARAGAVADVLLVDTDAGPRGCRVDHSGRRVLVSVDMGIVRVLGERTVRLDAAGAIDVTTADAGNPHAILFGTFARSDVESLGPRLSTHRDFPRGTNVEFAHVAESGIDVVVWERGVGITLACGTGACAVAAVACDKGLAAKGTPVSVRLPGGTLEVTIAEGGQATMRGPARHVFSGSIDALA